MSCPAVSVIIPAHGRVELLVAALDSVAAQTFRDYEVLVVDDGSQPPLAPVVESHPARPRVLRQQHAGPAAARNHGLREARGEIIAFLDSDDLWLPEKLGRFVLALRADSHHPIYHGPMIAVDLAGREIPGRTKPREGGRITQRLFESCIVDVPTVACFKRILDTAGGFDESLPVCEDYDLWLRLSIEHEFGYIPEPLALRRLHDRRLSKSRMARNLAVKAGMLERFWLANQDRTVIEPAVARARLGRVYFVAARAAYHEGAYDDALSLARSGRRYARPGVRARLLAAAAAIGSSMPGRRNGDTLAATRAGVSQPP
jgi:glycosyltransferase involved in cell wall biosynthesis